MSILNRKVPALNLSDALSQAPSGLWIKFYNSAVINIGKLPPHKRPKFGVAKQVIQKIVQVEKSEHQ